MPTPREFLDRLDTRHDELIRKLDELNAQIETALAQFGLAQFGKSHSAADPSSDAAADADLVDRPATRRAA